MQQVFTHFALTLTVYAAPFEGEAPARHFWVAPEGMGEAGFSNVMRKAAEHALRSIGHESYGKVKSSSLV